MELAFAFLRLLGNNVAIVFTIHLLLRLSNIKLKHFLKDITDVGIELKSIDLSYK